LTRLVRAGDPLDGVLDRLARILADFHSTARRGPDVDAPARPDAIRQRWEATFLDVRRDGGGLIPPGDLDLAEGLVREFLTGRTPLFDDRIRHGRVVDGHGDLLCDDIFCLPDGPRVLDCLEFDDRLRFVDGLDDVSFLAMDLESLGAPELARWFIDRYAGYAADPAPASLTHHYIAYRAFVRVKVACLRHLQAAPAAGERARSLAALALRHLRAGQVRLILVGGLPGSGKSTVAARTADAISAVLLSSDVIRRTTADGRPAPSGAPEAYRGGIYDRTHTDRLYEAILQRAARLLAAGETVVVDASFTDARHRIAAARVAESSRARLLAVRCTAPAVVRDERIRRRPPGPSEVTPAIAERISDDADPWPDSIALPTTEPIEQTVATMVRLVTG
jgi:predicted kinase